MPCFQPLTAWRAIGPRSPDGAWPITFNPARGHPDLPVSVPCGQCIGCRLERSRQWAVRCMHEASQHTVNAFVTLTYAPEWCPDGLRKDDLQRFWKRFRKRVGKVRYLACGEYGEQMGRPHYHACVFGWWPWDAERLSNKPGNRLYTSKALQESWGLGQAVLGHLTFESAAYVARYCVKKMTGPGAEEHYAGLEPEFLVMSRRPGIARPFLEKYVDDVFKDDTVVARGREMRPPRYYDGVFAAKGGDLVGVKRRREDRAKAIPAEEKTIERMRERLEYAQREWKRRKELCSYERN